MCYQGWSCKAAKWWGQQVFFWHDWWLNLRILFGTDSDTVTQSNNITPKVIATMITQDCPQPYRFSSQLPFPISHIDPVHCHANITGLCHFVGPLICRHRNFTWRSLCLAGECLRHVSWQGLLTRMSSFRLFNQPTNSLWICVETSWVLGMSGFVTSGFIDVRQFWKVKSSAVAKGCRMREQLLKW